MKKNNVTFENIDIHKIKFTLEFEFLTNRSLKIKVYYINKECLKKENFIRYNNDRENMIIWSFGKFLIDRRQLCLPGWNDKVNQPTCTVGFRNEKEMKDTLRKIYLNLLTWSGLNSKGEHDGNILLNNDHWYVL